ncbi:TonB-dependent receptor [Novosphingobium sp.]|uniref:TonB-dependent receptor n=1 Tax=Novosphingobium sp. TaxID=1874826 RepID=UPI0025FDF5A9|nr:TonB-dependent receptor [Novosphingobium sp.]
MKLQFHTSAALAAIIAFGSVTPAFAQATAQAAPDAVADPANEEPAAIVVTAQKRSENVQAVPVAVSVISGAALAAAARPSIESAAQLVPSLNFLKSGTTLNQTIFLRGVGTASFSIAGEPSVSTVVDGVVYARSGEAFSDLIDIAQLEVLRGPQGTLFGKNASAGVINITTQQPKHELSGTVETSYFGKNEFRTKGSINLPLAPDLAARVSGFAGQYDGNIFNKAVGKYVNGYKHFGGRVQVLYDPSPDLKLYFTADYHKNTDNCCAEVIATGPLTAAGVPTTNVAFNALPTPLGADTRTINQNLVTATKERGYGFSFQADVGVGSHTLTSITSYRNWNNTEIRDGDWLPQAFVGFQQLHDTGPQKTHTFTQEVRLTSPANQFLSYVLGAFYSNAFSERVFTRQDIVCTAAAGAPSGVLIPCGGPGANAATFPNGTADFGSRFRNVAVFGQAVAHVSNAFRLIGGLRYSHDELDVFHSRVSPLTGPGIQPNFDQGVFNAYNALVAGGAVPTAAATAAVASSNGVPFRTGTKSDNLSGKAALQYDFSRDVMAYASYTRGYKGPAFNVFYNLTATGTNVIAPETSNAYEIGLKNTLFDGKMTLNLAAFYAKYYNFQANNPDLVAGVVVTRFTNAGNVSTRGVEADFNIRPMRDFSITGGVAYTNAHVDQFLAPAGSVPVPNGTQLGFAPKWKGSVSADYRWRTGSVVDVFMGAQGNFQSSQLSLFAADPVQRALGTIPAYGLVNLSLGVGDSEDKVRVTFQVRNVFDKSYAAAITNGGPGGSYRYQIPRDADRYFGVTGRVNF